MRGPVLGLLALAVAWSTPCWATGGTALSAGSYGDGRSAATGFVGFPYLEVDVGHGFGRRYDATVVARSAWGNMQRIGLAGRAHLTGEGAGGLGIRALIDTWVAHPEPGDRWLSITGVQDYTAAAQLLYSWVTVRNTVLTLNGGVTVLGNRHPPAIPLGGLPPFLSFGTNATMRFDAELPRDNGLLFAFEVGMDFHLSGFDQAVVMPVFAVGIGYAR